MQTFPDTQQRVRVEFPVVLIVDNSKVGWQRVSNLIEGVCLPGQIRAATSARDALRKVKKLSPEIVIMDIDIPAREGLGLMKTIRVTYPFIHVVVLTSESSSYYRERCSAEGVDLFFDKATEAHHIPEVIRCLLHETTNN